MSDSCLFEMEIENFIEKNMTIDLTPLFQEMELELSRKLFKQESDVDSTERPLNFMENLTENLVEEFDKMLGGDVEKKVFLKSLTKIFAILLSNREDSFEKIKNVIKAAIKTVIRLWQGQN